jgi:hypothetical protein
MYYCLFSVFLVLALSVEGKNSTLHILKQAGLPNQERYKRFYVDNDIRAVDEVPGRDVTVHKVDFFLLSAPLSNGFRQSHPSDDALQNEMAHNGIGFRLYDEGGNELHRLSASFWACNAAAVDTPHLSTSNEIVFFNRAVVAFSVSKNDWESGYWSKTHHLATLSVQQYRKALDQMTSFAMRHPFLQGFELWTPDNTLLAPAITCNTFLQDIVWQVISRDVYQEVIIPQAYSVVVMNSSPHEAKTKELLLPLVSYFWPRYYDEHGRVIISFGETPELHNSKPTEFYLKNNMRYHIDIFKWVKTNRILPETM